MAAYFSREWNTGDGVTQADLDRIEIGIATRADAVHAHVQADVTGLPAALATQTTAIAAKADLVHTHTSAQISDATTVGKSLLGATTALAARTAIGAGTGGGMVTQNSDGTWPSRSTADGGSDRTKGIFWKGTLPGPVISAASTDAVVGLDTLIVTG
jgi:hypothetical protein